jgi:hypothetical protein
MLSETLEWVHKSRKKAHFKSLEERGFNYNHHKNGYKLVTYMFTLGEKAPKSKLQFY